MAEPMGALLAFQPAAGGAPNRFDVARAWIEGAKGLPAGGGGTHVAKFKRRNGSGAAAAFAGGSWVASAGSWRHPDVPGDDNAALLALLSAEGARVLDGLDGCFALLHNDAATGTLTAVPDHLGRLRFYVADAPEGLYLGTSPVALARATRRGVDPVAAFEFLATGVIYEDRSPFDGVRRLAGGKRHRFVGGRAAGEDDAPRVPPRVAGQRATIGEVAAACRAAVREWGVERPLPDLTGGLDSRLVVGLLLDAGCRFDVTVTGDAGDADVRIAAALARRLGLTLRHIPGEQGRRAQASFASVLQAAARVEGTYDAAEYAAIAAIHEPHSAMFGLSVNGSGGEVFRNYWWDKGHMGRKEGDAAGGLLRRFAGAAAPTPFLKDSLKRDPAEHFRGVLERTLAGLEGSTLPARFDHAYLHLRMRCWQGAIASATNEFWPTLSPLLLRRPLETLYRLDERERLNHRLIRAILLSFPTPFHTTPLATGFPPLAPAPGNLWRFAPGALALPGNLWRRLRDRLGRPDPRSLASARALLESGAADFLRPREMALRSLLEEARLEAFLARPALPLLGRLIALEWAAREAR